MKIIIFPEGPNVCEMYITGELSIEETARKDVPTGVQYKIVDIEDLPTDRHFRDAWEFDENTEFDGVGA